MLQILACSTFIIVEVSGFSNFIMSSPSTSYLESFKKCYVQESYRVIFLLMISNLIAYRVEGMVCWFHVFKIGWNLHYELEHCQFWFYSLRVLGECTSSKCQVQLYTHTWYATTPSVSTVLVWTVTGVPRRPRQMGGLLVWPWGRSSD